MIRDAPDQSDFPRPARPSLGPSQVTRRRLVRKPPALKLPTVSASAYRNAPGSAPGTTPAQTFPPPTTPTRQPQAKAPPRLRLVGDNIAPDARPPVQNPTPIDDAADPRWVLALQTAERLQGSVLPPEDRDQLTRVGKMMGLSAFDCALVLAIVQDQARRGIAPANCPAAGQAQLALIPRPSQRGIFDELRKSPLQITAMVAGLLAMQILLLWIWLG